jgi:Nineteen complex-related protein 2
VGSFLSFLWYYLVLLCWVDFLCRIMPQSLDQATISTSNGGPRYDAAYLKELKASTPTSRPPLPTNVDPYDADMSMDIGDISVQSIDMDVGTCPAPFIGVCERSQSRKKNRGVRVVYSIRVIDQGRQGEAGATAADTSYWGGGFYFALGGEVGRWSERPTPRKSTHEGRRRAWRG